MGCNDTIADMLTALRNASMRKCEYIDVNASRINQAIIQILKEENYIDNFRILKNTPNDLVRVYLRYINKTKPAIINLRRVSKPSLRRYVKKDKIPYILRGRGIAILSTPKGVMTDAKARENKTGGEFLCVVW